MPDWRRGYRYIRISVNGVDVAAHRHKVEHILGKPLQQTAVVHHRDGDGLNNENENLIVCENRAYHDFIEIRQRAYRACGNANWRRCNYCKKYDDVINLVITTKQ